MEISGGQVYACAACDELLDENTIITHPCLQEQEENQDNEVTQVEYVEGIGEDEMELQEVQPLIKFGEVQTVPEEKFRLKITTSGKRGDWTELDVMRLLDIYIKNFKALPRQKKLHNHYLWDRVMKDLQPYGNFSRFLVQSKIKKLRKTARAIIEGGHESTKWPYMHKVLELINVEASGPGIEETEGDANDEAEDDDDGDETLEDGEATVTGLQRWTVKETRHLIEIYTRHLPKFFEMEEPRKIAWDDILADLEFGLSQRYTMHQIRSKIRNVQNTFRNILEKKRVKSSTHWPLFKDVAELCKLERELSTIYNVPVAIYRVGGLKDPDFVVTEAAGILPPSEEIIEKGPIRWNDEETRELLNCYVKFIPNLLVARTSSDKEAIWTEITSEVNNIRRRKITPNVAKAKLEALKTAWEKPDEYDNDLAQFADVLNEIVSLENESFEIYEAEADETSGPPPKKVRVRLDDEDTSFTNTRKKKNNFFQMPAWFVHYQKEAQARHEQRMEMEKRLLSTFEKLLERIGA